MWSETCVRHCLTADTKPKPETIKHIFKNGSRVVDLPSKTTIYRIWMYVYIYTVYSNIYIYVYILLHAYKYTVCVYIIIYIHMYVCMYISPSLSLPLSLSPSPSRYVYIFSWCMRIYAYSMCLYVHSKYLAIDSAILHWFSDMLFCTLTSQQPVTGFGARSRQSSRQQRIALTDRGQGNTSARLRHKRHKRLRDGFHMFSCFNV